MFGGELMRTVLNLISVGFAVFNVGATVVLERKRRRMADQAEFLSALWSIELERVLREGDDAQ